MRALRHRRGGGTASRASGRHPARDKRSLLLPVTILTCSAWWAHPLLTTVADKATTSAVLLCASVLLAAWWLVACQQWRAKAVPRYARPRIISTDSREDLDIDETSELPRAY